MQKIAKAIGRRIEKRRKALDMTKQKLAQAADITWAMLNLYETGRSIPELPTLIRLAAGLQTTTGRLLQGIEKEI